MRTREHILATTIELAVEFGLEHVSYSKILKSAGVGSGTVFNLFSNKGALVNALFLEAADLRDREIMTTYSFKGTLKERFAGFLRGFARWDFNSPRAPFPP